MFERAGKKNSNVKNKQFWQQNNKPIENWTTHVFEEKYPEEDGFVTNPIDWKDSRARNDGNDEQTVLQIEVN